MAYIAPFRALRYDPARVPVADVVTQPYDKITPEMQGRYYAASPYNLVRVILGKSSETDDASDNPYSRARTFFSDWRRQGVFLQETHAALYLYSQRFTVPGQSKELTRKGFIGLGRLEDYASGVVFRHEQTLAKPKADRLDLLRATRAHFGQLFMLYSDPAGEIEGLLSPPAGPDIEVLDDHGVTHTLWRIRDPTLIDLVRAKMRDKKLVIADGHHRYETALNYRNERLQSSVESAVGGSARQRSSASLRDEDHSEAPYEMAMMTFVNMDSPGLVILPTHRVVHGLTGFSSAGFRSAAAVHFGIEEVDASIDAARANIILREAGRAGMAMLAVTADSVFLLDRPKPSGSVLLEGFSLRQQSLDVVLLHKCILEDALRISEEAITSQQNVTYVRDAGEALSLVRSGQANIAFLLNPVRMQQVRDLAFGGEVLPQKSTDFYPKLLSGLTIYALE